MAIEGRFLFLAYLKVTKSKFREDLRSDPRFDDLARRMKLPTLCDGLSTWDSLRSDPRFQAIVRRLNFP
jgi:hypothetical protein